MKDSIIKFSDDLWKIFRDYDRSKWKDIINPFICMEDQYGSYVYDNLDQKDPNNTSICGFNTKSLDSNFKCNFDLGDFVQYDNKTYVVTKLPALDCRTSIRYIKEHPMDVCYNGLITFIAGVSDFGEESISEVHCEDCKKLSENLVEDSIKQLRDKLFKI